MLLWAFVFFVIFMVVLWLIGRVLEKKGVKVEKVEEMEEEHWLTDPSYSFMPGNIFYDHTRHES